MHNGTYRSNMSANERPGSFGAAYVASHTPSPAEVEAADHALAAITKVADEQVADLSAKATRVAAQVVDAADIDAQAAETSNVAGHAATRMFDAADIAAQVV